MKRLPSSRRSWDSPLSNDQVPLAEYFKGFLRCSRSANLPFPDIERKAGSGGIRRFSRSDW
jgi:hypothetical protein